MPVNANAVSVMPSGVSALKRQKGQLWLSVNDAGVLDVSGVNSPIETH